MLKVGCAILITFFISVGAFGQEHYVGFNYGYGKVYGGDFSRNSFNSFGIKYQINNSEIKTSIYIEENFESIMDKKYNRNLQHLKTSIGANLNLGKKLYFIIGVGMNAKLLIMNKGYAESIEFKKVSFGGRFNTGIGFLISPRFMVNLLYQLHIGVTPVYIETTYPRGGKRVENTSGIQNFIQINIGYLIINKN